MFYFSAAGCIKTSLSWPYQVYSLDNRDGRVGRKFEGGNKISIWPDPSWAPWQAWAPTTRQATTPSTRHGTHRGRASCTQQWIAALLQGEASKTSHSCFTAPWTHPEICSWMRSGLLMLKQRWQLVPSVLHATATLQLPLAWRGTSVAHPCIFHLQHIPKISVAARYLCYSIPGHRKALRTGEQHIALLSITTTLQQLPALHSNFHLGLKQTPSLILTLYSGSDPALAKTAKKKKKSLQRKQFSSLKASIKWCSIPEDKT